MHCWDHFFIGSLSFDFLDFRSSSSDSSHLIFISISSSLSSGPMLGVTSVCESCWAYWDCGAGSIPVFGVDIGCWGGGNGCELSSTTLNSMQELDVESGWWERKGRVVVEGDVLVGSTGCCRFSTGRSDLAMTLMDSVLSLNVCLTAC